MHGKLEPHGRSSGPPCLRASVVNLLEVLGVHISFVRATPYSPGMTPPRGPRGHFLTGNLAEFRADRLAFFTRCAREYGDVVPMRLLGKPVLLLNRPDLIEQALVQQSKHFVKHFGLRFYKPILGNGLVTSEGDFWRRQRKLSAPAFQASRLAGYAEAMVSCTERMADAWERQHRDAAAGADGRVHDVQVDMMRLTLQI